MKIKSLIFGILLAFNVSAALAAGCDGQFGAGQICGNPVLSTGRPTPTSLNSFSPTHGSYWSDVSPFTAQPVFRVRDRLCVDDGCLIPTTYSSGAALMPNTRAATAINTAGANWQQPPIRSSIFALSSNSQIAISGMTTTSLNPDPTGYNSSQAGIALLGMALADHPTQPVPAWGLYLECTRVTALGYCFSTEIEVGNIQNDIIPLSVYGVEPGGRTIGIHLYSGGAYLPAVYYPASAAMDIGSNGGTFLNGFVFRNGALADRGGGVFNAIDLASSYRLNWQRNNAGADQLQAYITASNTTVGAAVQSLEFGASNITTLTSSALLVKSGASGTMASIGVGRTTSEGGLIIPSSAGQVFAATSAGDLVTVANTTLWLAANNGATAVPGIKIATTGLLTFPQYNAAGVLQTNASGVVTSPFSLPTGIPVLSGASGTVSTFGIGRTAIEGGLAAIATANQVFTGTVAGDIAVESNTGNLWLGTSVAGTPKAGIKIDTSGLLTVPQYTAGFVQTSGSGVVTSAPLTPPTRQVFKTGTSATYTRPTNPTPIQIRIRMTGGGGGGGGSGTGSTGGTGGDGTNTVFNGVTANKGLGAVAFTAGLGGAAIATSGATWGLAGEQGSGAQAGVAGTTLQGGKGGGSAFSGGVYGFTSVPNSGAGGSGGPAIGAVTTGAGGGAGAYTEFVISSPASTYTYTVGTGGAAASAGTSGNTSLAGVDGIIIVDEIYQ